jgi:hypothetical protein
LYGLAASSWRCEVVDRRDGDGKVLRPVSALLRE